MIANMIRQSFKGAEHIGLQLWGLFMQSAAMIYFIYFFFPAKQLNIQLVKIRTQSFQCCPPSLSHFSSQSPFFGVGRGHVCCGMSLQEGKLQVLCCVSVSAGQFYKRSVEIGELWEGIHTYATVQVIMVRSVLCC